jgi:hypothetical protein
VALLGLCLSVSIWSFLPILSLLTFFPENCMSYYYGHRSRTSAVVILMISSISCTIRLATVSPSTGCVTQKKNNEWITLQSYIRASLSITQSAQPRPPQKYLTVSPSRGEPFNLHRPTRGVGWARFTNSSTMRSEFLDSLSLRMGGRAGDRRSSCHLEPSMPPPAPNTSPHSLSLPAPTS